MLEEERLERMQAQSVHIPEAEYIQVAVRILDRVVRNTDRDTSGHKRLHRLLVQVQSSHRPSTRRVLCYARHRDHHAHVPLQRKQGQLIAPQLLQYIVTLS